MAAFTLDREEHVSLAAMWRRSIITVNFQSGKGILLFSIFIIYTSN